MRAAGTPVGLGCDGSSSNDIASLWLEARTALLLGKMRTGAAGMSARTVLDVATRGGAACLGRTGEIGELSVGACGDLVVWAADPIAHAGAVTDPVEAWLRCGPGRARDTVVAGRVLVDGGELTLSGVSDVLARHRVAATRLAGL
jgi:cytosine/adenosine deaminase-related metal-dependent hydrolase